MRNGLLCRPAKSCCGCWSHDSPHEVNSSSASMTPSGQKINAISMVRSSHSHFVKASGLRWLCCMLMVRVPWAGSIWGLPFLTVLCPSERYHSERGPRHQSLTERAWQMIELIKHWLPARKLIFVGDSSFAVMDLLACVTRTPEVSLITRLRMDAELWDSAPERKPRQNGRPGVKGARRPSPQQRLDDPATRWKTIEIEDWYGGSRRRVETYSETCVWYKSGHQPLPIRWVLARDPQGECETRAFMSTDLDHTPRQVLSWFVRRWRMEVTFEEARAHLGIETQRQWSDLAIARSTPILFGLFSLITLLADRLIKGQIIPVRSAVWYEKERPTFSDATALVRRGLLRDCHFSTSGSNRDVLKVPRSLLERLTDAVCYAASLDKVELRF